MKILYSLNILMLLLVSIAQGSIDNTYSTNTTITTDETFINVFIDAGVTVTISATGSLTCADLDFQDGNGSLVVESGGNLTINGNVVNNGTATLQIDHGGSLIPSSTTTFETANIRILKNASASGYSYVSPPISNATFDGGEYVYSESTVDTDDYGTWVVTSASDPIPVGNGYATYQSGNTVFVGTPNVAAVNLSLSLTSKDSRTTKSGHHLIGNPYPAAMDMDAFFALGSNTANTFASYYIWDPSLNSGDGGYETKTAGSGGFISSGQAFFIQLDYSSLANGSHTIAFDPSLMVSENNIDFFRTAASTHGEIVINFSTENDVRNKLTFRFDDKFTPDFDKGYDAYSIPFEEEGELRVKSVHNNKNFDLLALPIGDFTIPITLKTSKSLKVEAEVLKMDYIPDGYTVEIINSKTQEAVILAKGVKSSFDMSQLNHEVGLSLKISPPVLSLPNPKDSFSLYAANGQIFLKNLNQELSASNIWVYSLDGQVVDSWLNLAPRSNEYTLSTSGSKKGLYIVKIQTTSGMYSKKVILN